MNTKAVLLAMLLAVAGAAAQPTGAPAEEVPALIATAEDAGLTTLVSLVKTLPQATIDEVVNGEYTILAPTDDAFEALLAELGSMPPQDTVNAVLAYHVVPGNVFAANLTDGAVVETLLPGQTLTVEINGTDVFFVDFNGGKAQVLTPDVETGTSVVHVIDAVLLPDLSAAPTPEAAASPEAAPTPTPAPSGAAATLASVAALAGSLVAAVLLA